ncbi:MAG: hypothetical protein SCAL_001063 [Candidatus Syntrophoarchaeum caldarius]|uniref:Uncharacterized protein n=1 Tax=Candidatus Syntropharchaeum caldarium TaxID=1838285 RepID=A0A1F2P8V0_9EURY|nr:MAG: hypothetical protein SCAL_001063 [Candidatus Syntrophoarchaeum caldarius]
MEIRCPACGSKEIRIIEDPEVRLCFKSVKLEGTFCICKRCGSKIERESRCDIS